MFQDLGNRPLKFDFLGLPGLFVSFSSDMDEKVRIFFNFVLNYLKISKMSKKFFAGPPEKAQVLNLPNRCDFSK